MKNVVEIVELILIFNTCVFVFQVIIYHLHDLIYYQSIIIQFHALPSLPFMFSQFTLLKGLICNQQMYQLNIFLISHYITCDIVLSIQFPPLFNFKFQIKVHKKRNPFFYESISPFFSFSFYHILLLFYFLSPYFSDYFFLQH